MATNKEPTTPAPERVDARGPLILVVDDFADVREMYAAYLRFAGFRVDEAVDGLEALQKAAALLPDLVLMDLSLPGLDGWEATRRIKADAATRHIPVVALTGHTLAPFVQRAKDAGVDGFLAKPCLPEALVSEVKRLLASRRPH
jgi:two-component system, cell cycle response regulator DivK